MQSETLFSQTERRWLTAKVSQLVSSDSSSHDFGSYYGNVYATDKVSAYPESSYMLH